LASHALESDEKSEGGFFSSAFVIFTSVFATDALVVRVGLSLPPLFHTAVEAGSAG